MKGSSAFKNKRYTEARRWFFNVPMCKPRVYKVGMNRGPDMWLLELWRRPETPADRHGIGFIFRTHAEAVQLLCDVPAILQDRKELL